VAGPEQPAVRHGPPVPVAQALVLALTGGVLSAAQTWVNGGLGERTGSSLAAALVSFAGGLLLALLVVALRPRTRSALRPGGRSGRLPRWAYLAGLGGAVLITIGAAAGPVIGVALFTVGMVAGQTGGGLLIDRVGLGPGGRRRMSAARLAGAAMAVLAVGVARLGAGGSAAAGGTVLALLLASVAGGAAIAGQQAVVGRLQAFTGDPTIVVAVNFLVGTAALTLVVAGAAVTGRGWPQHWPAVPWVYLGGALGIGVVGTIALALPALGVLRAGLVVVAGQLAGGMLLDLLQPARAGRVGVATIAGVLLTFVAVAITEAGARRRASPVGAAVRLER
jgi:transporter family-2 protein